MKSNIHPKYYDDCQVSCVCGNKFTTGSTKPSIRVEICAKCHPFYTGQQKFVDSMGRVERFAKSQKTASAYKLVKKAKDDARKQQAVKSKTGPKTLKEMLMAGRV